jgi:hypothetical protein
MINVPPAFIGFGKLTEAIGASGCGCYVGLILVMRDIVSVANFASVEHVLFFFRTVWPKVKVTGPLSQAVTFCNQGLAAQRIVATVWSCMGRPVQFENCDAMYTLHGQFRPGMIYKSAEEYLHFLQHENQESFLWLLDGNAEMRFLKNAAM